MHIMLRYNNNFSLLNLTYRFSIIQEQKTGFLYTRRDTILLLQNPCQVSLRSHMVPLPAMSRRTNYQVVKYGPYRLTFNVYTLQILSTRSTTSIALILSILKLITGTDDERFVVEKVSLGYSRVGEWLLLLLSL